MFFIVCWNHIQLCKEGVFLDYSELGAPPVTSLAELQHVAKLLENDEEDNMPALKAWLAMLVAPGSSLGGARPKANFRNTDGSLWIRIPINNVIINKVCFILFFFHYAIKYLVTTCLSALGLSTLRK